MDRCQWTHRDPRHPHSVRDDHPVQRLAQKQFAALDRRQNSQRRIAWVDQRHAGDLRRLVPPAARDRLKMRHEPDFVRLVRALIECQRQKDRRVAQAELGRKPHRGSSPRPAHPVDHPVLVDRRLALITAIAGPRHQLQRPVGMPSVQYRPDPQKARIRVFIEEARQQPRPENRVKFVAEVRLRAPPVIENHAATATEARRTAASVARQPRAVRMKPIA